MQTTYLARIFIGRELQPRATYVLTGSDDRAVQEAAERIAAREFPYAKQIETLVTVEGR